ncbi:hypothetical protein FNV43_RR19638 [Rhamnella rubrinervis]|uniref:Purple acid phosphatase n=1 Tax=Rhamnella rubrinervis TaxID=2594499 RepID=A0A8K0GWF5_9ROSA|nr:hypothetical protein FNV43_RR19638 [Rhamnella rubrinervis]
MRGVLLFLWLLVNMGLASARLNGYQEHPLSKIAFHKATFGIRDSASIRARPSVIGKKGEDTDWVTVILKNNEPSVDDWIGVFSPANFNSSFCKPVDEPKNQKPYICSSPIKFQYANYSNSDYAKTGKATVKFQLINQRADFSFALFSGGLSNPKVVAFSNSISFSNPKAPVYPRLAQGKSWDEMTVTWTSGYNIDEAVPFVEFGVKGESLTRSPAATLTFDQSSMCGGPARTVGWRDPGFIHTSSLKDLWPNTEYVYRMGHYLSSGSYLWSKFYSFKSSPNPGQDSLQRVMVFGDMGKSEMVQMIIVIISQMDISFRWDQFTSQVEAIASTKPYMVASGNHERDWPNSGSFYDALSSGGECGVVAETMYYVPAENRAKFWYSTDYGMFHFCIADSENDWREGTEQYNFIEKCLASADRRKQPWLIFAAHRVLGYSSDFFYAQADYEEVLGRESLEKLWKKYKVDIAFFGHTHTYERTCPIYQKQCTSTEKHHYSGTVNGTIHVIVGGGGSHLSNFTEDQPEWSIYRDEDFGFVKMTAYNHGYLLLEYKKSSDGEVYDYFTIKREYKDVVACVLDSCHQTTNSTT